MKTNNPHTDPNVPECAFFIDPSRIERLAQHPMKPNQFKARELIEIFDRLPLNAICNQCGQTAMQCSFHNGSTKLHCWCDDCSHTATGISKDETVEVRSFEDCVHLGIFFSKHKDVEKRDSLLIVEMARLKGLRTPRLTAPTAQQAILFFAQSHPAAHGMDVAEARRLRALEEENGRLKRLVAELFRSRTRSSRR